MHDTRTRHDTKYDHARQHPCVTQSYQIVAVSRLTSKAPIWAFLLTHYAIRHLMCEAADQAGKDPDRLSFMRSLRVIRRQVTDQAALCPPQAA